MTTRSTFVVGGLTALLSAPVHAAGVPQMDPTWYPNQLLWLAVSFGLLYAIVSLFIAPSASKILRAREEAINDAIAQAERAKREAEGTRSQFEQGGHSARTKAAEFLAQAQAEITREASDAVAKLDRELAQKGDQANARIEDARNKATSSMQDATADLTAAMASKLLGRTVTAAEAEVTTTPIVKLKKAS